MRLVVGLICLATLWPSWLWARTTVACAPFATTAVEEYQWIGTAMAAALSMRVHQQPELNAITLRQVNAAMRHDALERDQLLEEKTAISLGRLLGADVILVGSYKAKWPQVTFLIKIIDPQKKTLRRKQTVKGELDKLVELEAELAAFLAKELGAESPDVRPGAFGTKSLKAWRAAAKASDELNAQSLGPRAADPSVAPVLPDGTLEAVKASLIEATKYDPDYGEAWGLLGVAQALLKQTKPAWRALGKATALGFGHHPTAVLGASFVRMREGRWDDAAEILRSAISRHPGFLHARGYLGELYNHIGRHQEALDAFEAYAKVAPHQPWALAQRGYSKSKLKDHQGAIADTIAAVDMLPASPSMLIQLASRYIDAEKYIGAEDALRQAMKLFPNEATAYVRLGYVYLLQGKDELAIPVSEKALLLARHSRYDRDRAYAHLNLARAYGRRGDLDKAFRHLGKARQGGLESLAEVDKDPKLKTLRSDPRYAKLN